MTRTTSPREVRDDIIARREIALIDLREEEPFARAHPLFAAQLPLSRLELDVLDRIPRRTTRIVLYDNGEGLVPVAAERLAALGYADVSALAGGLQGWRDAGYELFQDVNSYSKAFGELVEARRHTPSLPAEEVQALIDAHADIVILDARRFDEYNTMSIPGGISTPGAELVLRARELAPNPSTTVIVNCAGRTRSLIGAQSLVNARLPNKVFALRNGTIGWTLAGQKLEHGQTRRFREISDNTLALARATTREIAYRAGVKRIDTDLLVRLAEDGVRTLYRFDVRTPEEYEAGHIPGFRGVSGGQLVQETDMVAPVRGARIVLADDLGPRADMTASWLAQMGWEAYVLEGGFDGALETGPWRAAVPARPGAPLICARALKDQIDVDGAIVIDFAASPVFRKGHIPGARFAIRSYLAAARGAIAPGRAIVLTSPDGVLADFAAADARRALRAEIRVLAGGTAAWRDAGFDLETGLGNPLSPPEDVYRRPYEGTDSPAAAMQAYLDWEFGLVAQLARDGTHGFVVI